MSDEPTQTETDDDEPFSVKLDISLYPEGSSEVAIRQIGLGIGNPLILIEAADDQPDDGLAFVITGSRTDSIEELAAVVLLVHEALQEHLGVAPDEDVDEDPDDES